MSDRCCYEALDCATAASQNGFSTYKLSHKNNNIIQKMSKKQCFLLVKLDHFMTHLQRYAKHRFVMQPLQNPPLCRSTMQSPPCTTDVLVPGRYRKPVLSLKHTYRNQYFYNICTLQGGTLYYGIHKIYMHKYKLNT